MSEFLHTPVDRDIETISQIPVVPKILELLCRTTGMGFAAVARVTDTKWVACAVMDKIGGHSYKEGLGLGLFITSQIAKAHGGKMEVESTDEYTRFTLSMPSRIEGN